MTESEETGTEKINTENVPGQHAEWSGSFLITAGKSQ